MKNILILCTGNSCRSQIAHGYFNNFSKNKAKIYSAGIETHGLNINAVETMKRDKIDISSYRSNNVSRRSLFKIDKKNNKTCKGNQRKATCIPFINQK